MPRILSLAFCFLTALCFNLAVQAQESAAGSVPPATITGSGTTSYIPRWTGSATLGNSVMFQSGGKIGVGTKTPAVALDVNGRVNVSKSYQLNGLDVVSIRGDEGNDNFAVGIRALDTVTTGYDNTAVGLFALDSNNGVANTAVGNSALAASVGGSGNTAMGAQALYYDISGSFNTAVGDEAMKPNTTGNNNTAIGAEALHNNTTGNNNIAIGDLAAINVNDGNSVNIHIGNQGSPGDARVIRIGSIQSAFFAAGIHGETTGLNDAVPVVVDSRGQLGTIISSRRFKEDIQDMGDASEGLMRLRPVTFRYQRPFDDGSKPIQYGLIAEEVADVYPDLVTHSADGQVETVKYQVLDSMLLNELQRQQKLIQHLEERLQKLEAQSNPAQR